jgi:hypothetical protein
MGRNNDGAFSVPDDLMALVKRDGHDLVMENVRAHAAAEPPAAEPPAPPATPATVLEHCPHCQTKLSAIDLKFGNCLSCRKPLAQAGQVQTPARFEVRI